MRRTGSPPLDARPQHTAEQRDATLVERLPFPRLLIADDTGLGKTAEAGLILVRVPLPWIGTNEHAVIAAVVRAKGT